MYFFQQRWEILKRELKQMILTLHRRYPEDDHWEIDPEPIGSIIINHTEMKLEMDEIPLKNQIKNVMGRPITCISGLFSEDNEDCRLMVVDRNSSEYVDALSSELRRIGIEARRRIPAAV
jgi:hypothetical protein